MDGISVAPGTVVGTHRGLARARQLPMGRGGGINVWCRSVEPEQDVLRISLASGYAFAVSETTCLLTGSGAWVPASEFSVGDSVRVALPPPMVGTPRGYSRDKAFLLGLLIAGAIDQQRKDLPVRLFPRAEVLAEDLLAVSRAAGVACELSTLACTNNRVRPGKRRALLVTDSQFLDQYTAQGLFGDPRRRRVPEDVLGQSRLVRAHFLAGALLSLGVSGSGVTRTPITSLPLGVDLLTLLAASRVWGVIIPGPHSPAVTHRYLGEPYVENLLAVPGRVGKIGRVVSLAAARERIVAGLMDVRGAQRSSEEEVVDIQARVSDLCHLGTCEEVVPAGIVPLWNPGGRL